MTHVAEFDGYFWLDVGYYFEGEEGEWYQVDESAYDPETGKTTIVYRQVNRDL